MCIPDNNIHLRYSYLVASVLGGFVSYPAILCQFRGLQEPAVLFTGDIVTRLPRSWGGFMKTCEPANGYLPVPGPTSLCAYLAISFTCGTVILLTRSWGGYGKTCQISKACLSVPGPTSLCPQLAILFTCGAVILLTRSWGGYRKTCQLANGYLPVPGPTSTCNIGHLEYSYPVARIYGGSRKSTPSKIWSAVYSLFLIHSSTRSSYVIVLALPDYIAVLSTNSS